MKSVKSVKSVKSAKSVKSVKSVRRVRVRKRRRRGSSAGLLGLELGLHHRALLKKLGRGGAKDVVEQRHRVDDGVDTQPVADIGGERLCLLCDRYSANPHDRIHHYCGHCRLFLDDIPMDFHPHPVAPVETPSGTLSADDVPEWEERQPGQLRRWGYKLKRRPT